MFVFGRPMTTCDVFKLQTSFLFFAFEWENKKVGVPAHPLESTESAKQYSRFRE